MGQYYHIVNLDKQEYLDPHGFGDGLKLREFGESSMGTMTALAFLLADGNGRGGGDYIRYDGQPGDHPNLDVYFASKQTPERCGSWAGDRVVVAGDYADEGRFTSDAAKNLYDVIRGEGWTDITADVVAELQGYCAEIRSREDGWSAPPKPGFEIADLTRLLQVCTIHRGAAGQLTLEFPDGTHPDHVELVWSLVEDLPRIVGKATEVVSLVARAMLEPEGREAKEVPYLVADLRDMLPMTNIPVTTEEVPVQQDLVEAAA